MAKSYLDQVRPGGIRSFSYAVKDLFGAGGTRDAVNWYKKKIGELDITGAKFLAAEKKTTSFDVGDMYFYRYIAKHRDTLPYWDMYPLIFPFNTYPNGFIGINLHYLHPQMRAKLLDALMGVSTSNKKMALSWQILKGAGTLSLVQPCVKRYLYSQVASPMVKIEKKDWLPAALMPLQKFQKQSAEYVWRQA
jgi:hypothetical protein